MKKCSVLHFASHIRRASLRKHRSILSRILWGLLCLCLFFWALTICIHKTLGTAKSTSVKSLASKEESLRNISPDDIQNGTVFRQTNLWEPSAPLSESNITSPIIDKLEEESDGESALNTTEKHEEESFSSVEELFFEECLQTEENTSELKSDCSHEVLFWETIREPSCTDPGLENGHCACGEIHDVREITPYGHIEIQIPGREPTTEIEGYTEQIICQRCETVIRESEMLPALKANITLEPLSNVSSTLMASCGNQVLEDGTLEIHWMPEKGKELTYVTVSYQWNQAKAQVETFPAGNGYVQIPGLKKNGLYTIIVRAQTSKEIGSAYIMTTTYFPEPRKEAFARVEIVTEDYIWPTCDYVSAPPGNWGGGIINNNYVPCTVKLFGEEGLMLYDSTLHLDDVNRFSGAKMKIRGNTSSYYEKKSYKIKLNARADLIGLLKERLDDGKNYADKEWLLLNYGTSVFRITGDAVADTVGTAWSPDYHYIILYINGDYRGLYLLSESIKQGNGSGDKQWRVPVDDDGFVFEGDAYWWNEPLYFTTPMTVDIPMKYTFKYPDTNNINAASESYRYIQQYMTDLETALSKNDDSYLDYIDLDSFVKWILVHDYLSTYDSGGANIYLYKKDSTFSSKVFMGPNWDFDSAFYAVDKYARIRWNGSHFYYPVLFRKPSFYTAYKEAFRQTYQQILDNVDVELEILNTPVYSRLLEYENDRFSSLPDDFAMMKKSVDDFLSAHIQWMERDILGSL